MKHLTEVWPCCWQCCICHANKYGCDSLCCQCDTRWKHQMELENRLSHCEQDATNEFLNMITAARELAGAALQMRLDLIVTSRLLQSPDGGRRIISTHQKRQIARRRQGRQARPQRRSQQPDQRSGLTQRFPSQCQQPPPLADNHTQQHCAAGRHTNIARRVWARISVKSVHGRPPS